MKKQKALEDMTHQDLIEALVFDENISDNVLVSDDYALDKYGNSLITINLEGVMSEKKKAMNGLLLLTFNSQGRMISMEVATCKKGKKNWQIATSDKFVDFTQDFVGANKDIVQ